MEQEIKRILEAHLKATGECVENICIEWDTPIGGEYSKDTYVVAVGKRATTLLCDGSD